MNSLTKALAALLVSLFLVACGPSVQSFGPALAPAELSADVFRTEDGKKLPVTIWPAQGPAKAVIVALHGFQMYSGHFQDAGPWWAARGVTTIAYDQRGHGGAPERGIWGSVDALVDDARTVVRLAAARHPGLPVYLLGSSMGAAVAMTAISGAELPLAGTILIAPAVWGGEALHPAARAGLWLAAHVMPWNHASASDIRRQASDNIEMLRANWYDRKNIRATRFDTLYGLTKMMAAGYRAAPKLQLPILALYGRRDEIIPARPVFRTVERFTAPKRFVLYADGWHMLLRDLQAEVVWRDVATWVRDQKAVLPSGGEVTDLELAWSRLSQN